MEAKFKVIIDRERCIQCKRCVANCSFGALSYNGERIIAKDQECVACQRCASECPKEAIVITENPSVMPFHATYTERIVRMIQAQASTGGVILSSCGNDLSYPDIFGDLLLDAAQVTNPAIDPLREPIETKTWVGDKLELSTPIIIGHMSLGAISYNACLSILQAAEKIGTLAGTGEGGLHADFYQHRQVIVGEVASGRFGLNSNYLKNLAALEIKIGQGAKPGHGGHLPGEKVDKMISEIREIPEGTDALSPYPHHDIYSIEDLQQLIAALKETTRYQLPIGVKIAAVHNVAAIASGVVRSGANFLTIDGFRGGTGATPRIIRDHAGIPIEIATAVVDQRLREEGLRDKITLIVGGSIRFSADLVKVLALGADAIMIATPVLIAMGCRVCQQCHRGLCPWGIATQREDLGKRIDVDVATQQIVNLIHAWTEELREILGAMGIDAVESLVGNRDRLRYIGPNPKIAEILGVKHVGESW